jgi:hypothetical protein
MDLSAGNGVVVGAATRYKAVLVVGLPNKRCPGLGSMFGNIRQ